MANELELRQVPLKLQDILSEIQISSLHYELTNVTRFANETVDSFMQSFQSDGNALCNEYERLKGTKSPSGVDVECLCRSVLNFKSSIQVANEKVVKLRSMIHDAVMSSNDEIKKKEVEVQIKQLKITKFEAQIKVLDSTIKHCDESAHKMEIGARELDERAESLRQQSAQHRGNGVLWTLASTTVGFIFKRFTAGASLVVALAVAGIGLMVNYDSANERDRVATILRESASDERRKASVQRQRKREVNTKMQKIYNEIWIYEQNIREFSYTQHALKELEGYLLRSVKCISDATKVVLKLEKALHIIELQGDTFELLQEFFVDDPTEDFFDETHEEMRNLKESCEELTDMILRYSDSRGLKF